jgi:hypothetical protein
MHGPTTMTSPPVRRPRTAARRRWAAATAVVLVALAILGRPALRTTGRLLVAEDPLAPSDVIVVATHADGAGVLEAADLVHAGIAPRVAVFVDPPDSADREFLRRGIPYENATARSIRQLRSLGVDAVEQIPRAVAGTEDEGHVLPGWCDQRRLRSVVVVTTTDHSRRLRRVLRRAMGRRPTAVMVRPARFSAFDPDRWWQTRDGTRTAVIELEKLVLDVVRHPLS